MHDLKILNVLSHLLKQKQLIIAYEKLEQRNVFLFGFYIWVTINQLLEKKQIPSLTKWLIDYLTKALQNSNDV